MVTTVTVSMFYVGNFADIDTDETDTDTENPNLFLGTYGDLQPTDVTEVDIDDDGIIYDDEYATGDYLEYDTGSGLQTVELDSTSLYNATILLGDGSTVTKIVLVIQSTSGDVFISEYPPDPLDGLAIQSITLDSLNVSNAAGINQGFSSVDATSVVCFGLGTRINTPKGEVAVEQIKIGDLVKTLDHGAQAVSWINRSFKLRPAHNAAIVFTPGSLGPGLPKRPLRLSPQHRVLIRSRIAERMFQTPELLVAAKDLLLLPGVTRSLQFIPTVYCHFACQNHEVVFANGAEVETFLAGHTALRLLSDQNAQVAKPPTAAPRPARPIAKGPRLRQLLARHCKNRQPVQLDTSQSLTIV